MEYAPQQEKRKQIHSSSFLINPTTNLFPLSGQSGNRGISITITLKCKIWSMELIKKSSILPYKLYQC